MTRLLQLLGIAGIAFVQVQSSIEFNCLRTGNTCAAGSYCGTNGNCRCGATKGNYDCGTEIVTVGSDCPCENAGSICLPDDITCICSERFYGPTCRYKTLDVKCSNPGSFILNVNVPGNPTCYVKGFETTCTFSMTTPSGAPTGWMGKFLEASLTNTTNCGLPTRTTDSNGVSTRCFTVICRYEATYLTGLDFEAVFCCGAATQTVTSAFLYLTDNGLQATTVSADPAGANIVTVILKNGADTPIVPGSAVDIGSTVKLEFTLDPASDFATMRVVTCKAKDNTTIEVEFISNSCSTKTFVETTSPLSLSGSSVVIETKAIKFTSGTTVTYECSVRICRQISDCTASVCTNDGRKKREITASTNSTEQKTLVTYIRVNDPLAAAEVKSAVQDAVAQSGAINLSAAVIGLAVVVLVLLGVCLLLGVCIINRRAPVKDIQG